MKFRQLLGEFRIYQKTWKTRLALLQFLESKVPQGSVYLKCAVIVSHYLPVDVNASFKMRRPWEQHHDWGGLREEGRGVVSNFRGGE